MNHRYVRVVGTHITGNGCRKIVNGNPSAAPARFVRARLSAHVSVMAIHAAVISMTVIVHHSTMIAVPLAAHVPGIAMPAGTAHVPMPVPMTSAAELCIARMDKAAVRLERQDCSAAQLDAQFAAGLDDNDEDCVAGIICVDEIDDSLRQVGCVQRVASHAVVEPLAYAAVVVAIVAVHTVMVEVVAVLVEIEAKPIFQKNLVAVLRRMKCHLNLERRMVLLHVA